MKLTIGQIGMVSLGVLALLCIWWWPEGEAVEPLPPVVTPNPAPAAPSQVRNPAPPRRPLHGAECADCPSLVAFEELKRIASGEDTDSVTLEWMYAYAEEKGGCSGLLLKAVLDGDPHPDSSPLGGCGGRTPLHMADTPDQTSALLAAGADPNAQDKFGNAPLHSHARPATPTEDSLAIIDLLLDAGADPRLENEFGEAPWKVAQMHSIMHDQHLFLHDKIAKETEARGFSAEAYLALQPHLREQVDGLLDGYLVEAKIRRKLLNAAVTVSHPELLATQEMP